MPEWIRSYVQAPGTPVTKENWLRLSRSEWWVVSFLVKAKYSDEEIIQFAKDNHLSYYESHARRNPAAPEEDLRAKIKSAREHWAAQNYQTSCEGGVFRVLESKQLKPEIVLRDGLVRGQSKAEFVKECVKRYGCARQTAYNILKRAAKEGLFEVDDEQHVHEIGGDR
jgi:hypothetical protein